LGKRRPIRSRTVLGVSILVDQSKNMTLIWHFRCLRHFAIYEQQWPSRVPPYGTSSATPREEITPVEQRHIVRIGPKVSSAACKAKNLVRGEQDKEGDLPSTVRPIRTWRTFKVSSAAFRPRPGQEASGRRIAAAYRALALARNARDEQDEEEERPPKRKAIIGPKVSSAAYKARNLVRDEQEKGEDRPSTMRPIRTWRTFKVSSAAFRPRPGQEASDRCIAAAYRALALAQDEQEEEEERPSKRKAIIGPKVSSAAYRGSRRDQQDEEEDRPSKRQKELYGDRNASEPVKRKRGRPRLSSPRVTSKSKVKVEELQADIPVVAQPRATNGRFGKKDKSWRKSREYTGVGSTVARSDEDDLGSKTPGRKRGIDAVEDFENPPKKKSTSEQNLDIGNDIVEVEGPGQKVLPRPVSGFRGGRLFSNPNPLRFALHAWAAPLILDESSSDDEKQPETPDDGLSSAIDIAPAEELMDSMFLPMLSRAPPLTCKPSPFVFAKNRWNATSVTLNKVAHNNRRISTNFTLSEDNLRPNLRTNHASSKEEVILFPLHLFL
jgi:hypothetical protein